MKVAIVHELLTRRGGAEKVAKALAEMFPSAPIYTLLYDERKLGDWFPRERVRTPTYPPTCLPAYLPTCLKYNHHLYLPFFPKAVESWGFSPFDLVISSSTAFVHGIRTYPSTKHLCYVHSPARYLWDQTNDVLERASQGLLGPLKKRYLQHIFHKLRLWDSEVAFRPDLILANSHAVQRRIELYWRRKSTILYPPVELQQFLRIDKRLTNNEKCSPYLVISTLTPYKRIDLAIETCTKLGKTLLIAGEGPDRKRLERMAGPTVQFLGYVSEEEKLKLYAQSRALLFPGEDDFGIAPIEAMASGTPVIAYRGGGVLETIVEGETGEFFSEPTTKSLVEAMKRFEEKTSSSDACRKQAENFGRERFEEGIREAVDSLTRRGLVKRAPPVLPAGLPIPSVRTRAA